MAVLDAIAAHSDRSAGEKALHALLGAHAKTVGEIEALHRRFGMLIAASNGNNSHGRSSKSLRLRREDLESLYLLLKEQVHGGAELSDVVDEMHETVYRYVLLPNNSTFVCFTYL